MQDVKVVKAGTHGFFDVFTGLGWLNHVRIRMVRGETLVIPERYNMPIDVQQQVKKLIREGKTKFSNFRRTINGTL